MLRTVLNPMWQIALVIFAIPIVAECIAPQNPPSGFHDLVWGVDIGKMHDFKLEKADRYGKYYVRLNEDQNYEGVALK